MCVFNWSFYNKNVSYLCHLIFLKSSYPTVVNAHYSFFKHLFHNSIHNIISVHLEMSVVFNAHLSKNPII